MDKVRDLNARRDARDANAYDFKNLYTRIPHEAKKEQDDEREQEGGMVGEEGYARSGLKEEMKWVIEEAFAYDPEKPYLCV